MSKHDNFPRVNSEKTIESYREIEALYEQKNLPVLDEIGQRAIRQFLKEHDCENLGGAVIPGDGGGSTKEAKSLYRSNLINQRDDTFVGPYFAGEDNSEYYPNGVAVWSSGDIGAIR